MRIPTSLLSFVGALGVCLAIAPKVVSGVTNVGLYEVPLPFRVKTHPLELSPALFAHTLPLANAPISFAPTDASQTALGDIPFPTGAWWTNLVLEKGDTAVATMPYSFAVKRGKLHASYPFRVVLPSVIQNGFLSEIVVSATTATTTNTNNNTPWQQQVVGFDAFGVALRFAPPTPTEEGEFIVHLVRGSPYITVEFTASVPVLESMDGVTMQRVKRIDDAMTDMEGKPLRFRTYAVQISNGHTWYVFVSDPACELRLVDGTIRGTTPLTGVVRIALSVSADALPFLLESAPVYPVGGQVKYSVDTKQDTALVEFQWKTRVFPQYASETSKQLLMLALPHQNDTFVASTTILDEFRYTAIRGLMVGVLGDTWQMEEDLPAIEWSYDKQDGVFGKTSPQNEATRAKMADEATQLIARSLKQDVHAFPTLSPDSYNFGKLIARDARLLLIADAFQQDEIVQSQLTKLKELLTPWLTASNPDALVYDKRFGGVITTNGLNDVGADYGNGWYNDHHFHYGYLVNALAVVRKYDPAFIQTHATAVAMIVADIGAPIDDGETTFLNNFPARHYFPTARHKDWFVGHSYASGLFIMNVGKSQESSSECINAYYGLALLSSLDEHAESDPQSYYHYARLLLALELRATKKYWHMRENSQVYEPIFARNAMVGVVGEMSVTFSTWFGSNPEYVHGINMIPFTPITAQLMNEAYVAREYDQLRSSYAALGSSDIWKSIIVMDHAILDGQAAWKELTTEVDAFDTWNSKTNALFWIATRPSWFNQKDRAKLTKPNFHDEDKCFGFPACSTAGANGTSLMCCDSLPGCCPNSLACCPQKDVSKLPINACFGEHQCAVLGLGCCNSLAGCCEPDPITGTVLGCCKDQTVRKPKPTTQPVKQSSLAGYCSKQPKCNALGLLCCDAKEGCCQPDPVTGATLDCCVAETDDNTATCHTQPLCAAAKLDCCALPGGCCSPDPASGAVLDCCSTVMTPATSPPTEEDKATCKHEPECAKAGLDCCLSPQGCCMPDPVTGTKLLCCQSDAATPSASPATSATPASVGDGSSEDQSGADHHVLVLTVLGVAAVVIVGFGIATCYRRRDYAPVGGSDMRTWICGALVVVIAAFFVYLVAIA